MSKTRREEPQAGERALARKFSLLERVETQILGSVGDASYRSYTAPGGTAKRHSLHSVDVPKFHGGRELRATSERFQSHRMATLYISQSSCYVLFAAAMTRDSIDGNVPQ